MGPPGGSAQATDVHKENRPAAGVSSARAPVAALMHRSLNTGSAAPALPGAAGVKRKASGTAQQAPAPLEKREKRPVKLPGVPEGLDLEAMRHQTWRDMVAIDPHLSVQALLDAGPPTALAHRFDTRARLVAQEAHILKLHACVQELTTSAEAVHIASQGQSQAAKALVDARTAMTAAQKDAAKFRAVAERAQEVLNAAETRAMDAQRDAAHSASEAMAVTKQFESAQREAATLTAELDAVKAALASAERNATTSAAATSHIADLEARLHAALRRTDELSGMASAAKASADAASQQLQHVRRQAEDANNALTAAVSAQTQAESARDAALAECASLAKALKSEQEAHEAMGAQLAQLQAAATRAMHASSRADALDAQLASQEAQFAALKAQYEAQTGALRTAQQAAVAAEAVAADADARLGVCEAARARLHSQLQELRGAIRVLCRVRPMGADEDAAQQGPAVSFPSDRELRGRGIVLTTPAMVSASVGGASASALSSTSQAHQHTFALDRVFGPDSSQAAVFEEVEPVVQNALDGGTCCVFAYGPTGSGKTHTMLGTTEQRGVVPRALDMIFGGIARASDLGWTHTVSATALEVYCDDVHDLLVGHAPKVDIKLHPSTAEAYVPAATVITLADASQAAGVIATAAAARATGATLCNARSSRSHLVVTLRLRGVNESSRQSRDGVLHLVDLAGSERLSRSGVDGAALRETQAINSSLSSLGDVIAALGSKAGHVPYRNSALTWLLSSALGVDSKVLMVMNVAPCSGPAAAETLCTLRFGAKVSACELAPPKKRKGELGGLLAASQAKTAAAMAGRKA